MELRQLAIIFSCQLILFAGLFRLSPATVVNLESQGYLSIPVFSITVAVSDLKMKDNAITTIGDNECSTFTVLSKADFSDNQITYVSPSAFEDTILRELRLANNALTSFLDVSAVGPTLYRLHLEYNAITSPDNDWLVNMTKTLDNLALVYLKGNKLSTVPDLCELGDTMVDLNLRYNPMVDPTPEFWNKFTNAMTKISFIGLGYSSMTQWPDLNNIADTVKILTMGSFQGVVIPDLSNFTIIQSLWFNASDILAIPDLSVSNPTLTKLNLEHTKLTCTCELAWLKQAQSEVIMVGLDLRLVGATCIRPPSLAGIAFIAVTMEQLCPGIYLYRETKI